MYMYVLYVCMHNHKILIFDHTYMYMYMYTGSAHYSSVVVSHRYSVVCDSAIELCGYYSGEEPGRPRPLPLQGQHRPQTYT